MNTRVMLQALTLGAVVCPFALTAHGQEGSVSLPKSITVLADPWCPFNCEPDGADKGFMVDIVAAALAKSNIAIEYKTSNWARAITDTRLGRYNAIIGAAKNDAPDFLFPDTAQGSSLSCFFVTPSSTWKFTTVESLSKITLGVIKDYSYGDMIDGYIQDPKGENWISHTAMIPLSGWCKS